MKDKTVFIFGAGSTKALNMPLSEEHKGIFRQAAEIGSHSDKQNDNLLQKLYRITESRFKGKNYNIGDVYNLIDTALTLQIGLSADEDRIEYID